MATTDANQLEIAFNNDKNKVTTLVFIDPDPFLTMTDVNALTSFILTKDVFGYPGFLKTVKSVQLRQTQVTLSNVAS